MTDQNRDSVYQGALSNARAELQQIQSEFDQIARRKEYLSQVLEAIAPLLDGTLPSMVAQVAPLAQAAPVAQVAQSAQMASADSAASAVRFFDPTSYKQHAPQAEAAPELSRPAEYLAPPVEQPVGQALVEAAAEPNQEIFLKQDEAAQPEVAPATGGSLEQRINFALNFALLS